MSIYKTRTFARLARRARITDSNLREAIERAERGLVDAYLGGGLIKQRIARAGQGRSGGYRMIVVFRAGDLAVFIYSFAKSERDNIEDDELETMREIAATWLAAAPADLLRAVANGVLLEVQDGN
ncbi:type II toxin-antitoxin system RelE/ParE family toxin [Labrys okinawensis]|uniref:type II toxin-antitoxin system RelE/ParE family toxin n=1 Tax=Labrys okinawensis TaxID=346911 RepID=UPI0039BC940E